MFSGFPVVYEDLGYSLTNPSRLVVNLVVVVVVVAVAVVVVVVVIAVVVVVIVVVFHLLPTTAVKRHQAPHIACTQDARAIHFGAWVHGGSIGIMNASFAFPYVGRLVGLVLRTPHARGKLSTIFLALNVPSGLHTDPHNHEAVEDILVPLSQFEGGELFVAEEHGDLQLEPGGIKGSVKPITFYTSFWARRKHAVMPWQGDRFILGSYHDRNLEWLPQSDRLALADMGMQLLDL